MRALRPSIDSKDITMINAQKRKDIGKIVHVTARVQPSFLRSYENTFVCKENNNNIIYSVILLHYVFL